MYQVLIVDDEPIVKIALRSMIDWSELGFHICATASNGEEALELARYHRPQLIICDLKMPVMDGIELIQAVKAEQIDCEFLVISNYEDFNYVRNALLLGASDYILKVSISPEELTAQLEKIRQKLDEKAQTKPVGSEENALVHQQGQHAIWRDFFTYDSYEISSLVHATGIRPEQYAPLALCQISFDRYIQNMEALPSMELLLNTFRNAVEQFSTREILFFGTGNILLIIPETELGRHQITISDLAARIAQLFEYYMSLSPAILYQDRIPDLNTAKTIYHNFQELLELNFYGPLGQADASSLTVSAVVPEPGYKDLAARILTSSDSSENRAVSACQQIEQFLNTCRQQKVMPSKVIQYCVRLLGDLEYQTANISSTVHDKIADCAELIRNAATQEDLFRNLQDTLSAIFQPESIPNDDNDQYSTEVQQALHYIKENYNKKISLTAVAEHVGLSSGYLCRIFKEETGASINAYINHLRMTKAGELLKDKNSYIKEVAVSVGFEDQLYFSRQFKRYYGVTPSEYRTTVQ
jgi:two-component system response regulator YesN